MKSFNKKVLLIENNEVTKLMMKSYLEKIELLVDFVSNEKESLELTNQNIYDAIFINNELLQIDTYSLKNTPIIIALGENVGQGKSHIDYYLKKPINKDELYRVLNEFLNLHLFENDKKYDLKNLINSFGEELTFELLSAFKEQYGDFEIQLNSLSEQEFFSYIHKLKGSANSLGFLDISDICLKIEAIKPTIIKILIHKLTAELKLLFKFLL